MITGNFSPKISLDKSKIETILKEAKEKLEKLERQKANLIREITEARKTIEKLQKGDAHEGEDNSEDISDSISAKSSQNKTIRSEDMVTIERLQKQNNSLESKLKSSKKKFREEKTQFNTKIEQLQTEIEEKNMKLKSLKDTLVEKFKNDIVKIYGEGSISSKLGQKEKEIEARLHKNKEKEIKNATSAVEKKYKVKLEGFKQLFLLEKQKREKEETLVREQAEREENKKLKRENENKLKILKENKGTFVVAFDNSLENVVTE